MKKSVFGLVALLSLSGLVASCDSTRDEPRVEKKELVFGAEAGEQSVRVFLKGKRTWRFGGFIEDSDKIIEPEETAVDTLSDGTIRVQHDWTTFHISKGMDNVKVRVAENTSPQQRKIIFVGQTTIADGATFTVIQKGKPSKN